MDREKANSELKHGAMTINKVIGLLELVISHSNSGGSNYAYAEKGIEGLMASAQVDLEILAAALETEFPNDEDGGQRETTVRE